MRVTNVVSNSEPIGRDEHWRDRRSTYVNEREDRDCSPSSMPSSSLPVVQGIWSEWPATGRWGNISAGDVKRGE